uniref:Uncharacterized protein n=1 Tax=Arundo donax TaxID=35708 RepID=A0A0A9C968_ARUDO
MTKIHPCYSLCNVQMNMVAHMVFPCFK